MKYLFFFVHPSKYFFLKNVINKLNSDGHQTDIIITGKQNLEELVKSENWSYINIFPRGRRIKGVNTYISSAIFTFITIYKLLKYTKGKKYDLFITDDLLTFAGRVLRIPSIFCTDDDLTAVPESFILMMTSTYVLSPAAAYMGRYERKKIGYLGYKSIAHLHPNCFTPERELLDKTLKSNGIYFFIRCVSVTSTHDLGNKGIDDSLLRKIINHLSQYGQVILNSERTLPSDLEKYTLDFKKRDVAHYIAFAKIFISDSTTMCAEAAVLGVPAIEIDDWYDDFGQYKELNGKYGLIHGFKPNEEEKIFSKLNEMLYNKNLSGEYSLKRKNLLHNTIDISAFMYWLLSNYPQNVKKYFNDKEIQLRFKS